MKKRVLKKFKKMSALKLKHRAFNVSAAADPEYIKTVEKLIERKIVAEKDTANYNSNVISYFIDKTVLALRDCGQRGVKPGDAFKIDAHMMAAPGQQAKTKTFNLDNPLNKDYEHWAFNNLVGRELRTHFILRTEALDTFESLIDELDGLMPQYMSIVDWNKLKMVISKGNERLSKNKLIFIEPETILGKEMRMSAKEMEKFQIAATDLLKYDYRSDGPDLIALRELVNIAKGEKVHDLSIGAGFFAKYVNELMEVDCYGIIFHVEKDKLKEIKLYVPYAFDKAGLKNNFLKYYTRYAPTEAAYALAQVLEESYSNLEDAFNKNNKYFVVVPGTVSGPMHSLPFNYERLSFNDVQTMAGEVLLYKTIEDRPTATRIYFVPESYESFHPYHQHGSVIFGNNDQSYHSCTVAKITPFGGLFPRQFEYDYDSVYFGEKLFDSSFYAYWVLKMHPQKLPLKDLMRIGQTTNFVKACCNHYEETDLATKMFSDYIGDHDRRKINNKEWETFVFDHCLKYFAPLHKRWHLRQYLTDGVGLVLKRNEGMIDKVAHEAKASDAFNYIENHLNKQNKKS